MESFIIIVLLVGLLIEIPLALYWLALYWLRSQPAIHLDKIVEQYNAQRRTETRQAPAPPPSPPPPPAMVQRKCEIRAYLYEDAQAITIHTNPGCAQHQKEFADPTGTYRGAFGRSLRAGVGLKETRGGAHTWEEKA